MKRVKYTPLGELASSCLPRYHQFSHSGLTLDLIEMKLRTHQYPSVGSWYADFETYYNDLATVVSPDSPCGLMCMTVLQYFEDDAASLLTPPTPDDSDGDRLLALFDSALEALPNGPGGMVGDDDGDPLEPDPIRNPERIPTYSSDALIRLHQVLSELHSDDDRRQVARILRTYEPSLANLKTILTFSLPACFPGTVALLDNFLDARGLKRIDPPEEDDFKEEEEDARE
jgi:hypothetical protein